MTDYNERAAATIKKACEDWCAGATDDTLLGWIEYCVESSDLTDGEVRAAMIAVRGEEGE